MVDDVELNRQVAQELLEKMGLIIELANDGFDAIQQTEENGPFDAILMDLQMPEMDGFDATRTIRKNPAHLKLPIIAMTAHAMSGIWEQCQAAGMDDHVAKPIDIVGLSKTLLRWIPEKTTSEEYQPQQATPIQPEQQEAAPEPVTMILPGINVRKALQQMDNDAQFFKKMLLIFQRDFSETTGTIRTILASEKEEELLEGRRLAHTIKGVAGHLAAESLHSISRDLENAILANQRETWPALLDRFEEALTLVLQSIDALSQEPQESQESRASRESREDHNTQKTTTPSEQPNAATPSEEDHVTMTEQLQQLYQLILENHSDAEELCENLIPLLQEEALKNEVEQLQLALSHYDFDSALPPLERISEHYHVSLKP